MKGIFITLIITVYVMLSLYKRFKRTIADNAKDMASEAYDSQEVDEEPSFVYEEPVATSNPYFSYEYETPAAKPSQKSQHEVVPQSHVQPVTVKPGFDLRQAVIYQTVLNNHYIDEINQ